MAAPHEFRQLRQGLSRRQELWLYGLGGVLALTGAGWLLCHYWLREPGPAPHPLEVWWLRAHGAAMIGFLIVFGTLLPGHVVRGWRHGMNRNSGIPVVTAAVVLMLTGYGLYYVVDDDLRGWVSIVHWAVGLAAVGAVTVHAMLGKQARKLQRQSRLTRARRPLVEQTIQPSSEHPR